MLIVDFPSCLIQQGAAVASMLGSSLRHSLLVLYCDSALVAMVSEDDCSQELSSGDESSSGSNNETAPRGYLCLIPFIVGCFS